MPDEPSPTIKTLPTELHHHILNILITDDESGIKTAAVYARALPCLIPYTQERLLLQVGLMWVETLRLRDEVDELYKVVVARIENRELSMPAGFARAIARLKDLVILGGVVVRSLKWLKRQDVDVERRRR